MSETKKPESTPLSEQDLEQVSGGAVDQKIANDKGSGQAMYNPKELSVDKSVPWKQ